MELTWKTGIFVVMATIFIGVNGENNGSLTVGSYPYHVKLDDNYDLQWDFNSTHIMFMAHVKTKGYIGLGISDHGSMYPSDVIIAWVKDGEVHFADRHATGYVIPPIDDHQDWYLVIGKEEGEYTSITMVRQLDTCDDQDFPILPGTTRLIYSYSPTDPDSDSTIPYHGKTRGTKSVLLLDPPTEDSNHNTLPDDVIHIDFINYNYNVPSADTSYHCTLWKLPPLKQKHHVIRYEPVITKGHEMLLHHIVLYYCAYPFDDIYIGAQYNCYQNSLHYTHGCSHTFLAWAIGGEAFDYPAHVGHSLGTSNDPVYFKMETHYDNVYMKSGMVDNSGIRLYLTKQLRPYDAATVEVGIDVGNYQIIPPFSESFMSRGYCHKDCLAEALGDKEEIYVFSDLLHSHLMGRKLSTRIIRNGVELPPIQQDKNFDFNYQEQRQLAKERVVKKGDTLFTDCYYDSSDRTNVTYGGLSSRNEMCTSYILYYPRIPLTTCLSRPIYNQFAGQNIHSIIPHLDFSKESVRDQFQKIVDESDIKNVCKGDKHFDFGTSITPQPNITKLYQPVDNCKN